MAQAQEESGICVFFSTPGGETFTHLTYIIEDDMNSAEMKREMRLAYLKACLLYFFKGKSRNFWENDLPRHVDLICLKNNEKK